MSTTSGNEIEHNCKEIEHNCSVTKGLDHVSAPSARDPRTGAAV